MNSTMKCLGAVGLAAALVLGTTESSDAVPIACTTPFPDSENDPDGDRYVTEEDVEPSNPEQPKEMINQFMSELRYAYGDTLQFRRAYVGTDGEGVGVSIPLRPQIYKENSVELWLEAVCLLETPVSEHCSSINLVGYDTNDLDLWTVESGDSYTCPRFSISDQFVLPKTAWSKPGTVTPTVLFELPSFREAKISINLMQ